MVIIAADYALVGAGEVYRKVRLEVDGTRIIALSQGTVPGAMRPDVDFGPAVITPGLVNPHAHLELEFCAGRVPFTGSFTAWLQRIRDLKREEEGPGMLRPLASLKQLAASGCTTVVDHHTVQLDWAAIEGSGLRYVPLREFFQFNNHAPDLDWMRGQARRGFAPHAPYTASREVAQACRALADEAGWPLSVHLAEIREELSFIRDGVGAEIEQLNRMAGMHDEGWRGSGQSPVRYLAEAGLLDGPAYVIHVNYLEPGDLELLSMLKPTVVYCPRSHAFFGHPAHPLEQYLAAGVPVALGTDSLASNERLSPLYEAAVVRQRYPAIGAAELFQAITTQALEPLGWASELGRLATGYMADFAVFPLQGEVAPDFACLFDAVLASGASALTVANGRVLHAEERIARRVGWAA